MIFDDGNREVPGGVGGPERVIIVGAGAAGLTAANALRSAGVECIVLEARKRIGGRVDSVAIGGTKVDLGAAWIHHPDGNPLSRVAEAAGVPRVDGDFRPGAVFFDPADGSLIRPSRAEVDALVSGFFSGIDGLGLGADATVEEAVSAYLSGREHQPWALNVLRTMAEAEGSAAMAEMAIGGFPPSTLEYGGSSLGDFPVGGYAAVLAALAAGTEVRTGAVVTAITHGAHGVEVTLADGTIERGSHALVTVPLGVLQAGTIRFEPGLGTEKESVIARLGFGRFEKVVLAFDEPVGVGQPHLYPLGADEFRVVMAMERFTGRPLVVATAFGSSAGLLVDGSDEEVVGHLMDHLRAGWGPVPDPVEVARSGWARDPFSRGAYTFVPPGSRRADLDLLGQPVGGRLLFAGEATGSARVGYLDGAFSTAVREAKRLLGVPAVELEIG